MLFALLFGADTKLFSLCATESKHYIAGSAACMKCLGELVIVQLCHHIRDEVTTSLSGRPAWKPSGVAVRADAMPSIS
jgi:hypothetical protein